MSRKIEGFVKSIPDSLMDKPGSVFYSGRRAFESPSDVYVLRLNSRGNPEREDETVRAHIESIFNRAPDDWSRYCEGTKPFHRRVLYLFRTLRRDARQIPASNVVFLRSEREEKLGKDQLRPLATLCWPFHKAVIERLKVRVVVCLGKSSGDFVRKQVNAYAQPVDCFSEDNGRGWRSCGYRNSNGLSVVQLTHPSIADWTAIEADPTELVQRALEWSAANPSPETSP